MTDFSTTSVPEKVRSGRQPMDNPFKTMFPTKDGEAITFTVEQGRDSLEARRYKRQVRKAASEKGLTGRIQLDDLDGGGVQFTVWTTDKISRKRKTKSKA